MNKFFFILLIGAFYFGADAQEVPTTEPYGKIKQADLEMKACDFEKDANAEILFDKASAAPEGMGRLTPFPLERQVRIKVFNASGRGVANVRIAYYRYENRAVYGVYKIPEGYKTEALSKSISLVMPDQSIIFKRTVAQDDGTILVKYVLNHKKEYSLQRRISGTALVLQKDVRAIK